MIFIHVPLITFTAVLLTHGHKCASLACLSLHPHLAEVCVRVFVEEGCCAEQVWLQEGV